MDTPVNFERAEPRFPGQFSASVNTEKPHGGQLVHRSSAEPEVYVRLTSGIQAREWIGAWKRFLTKNSEYRSAPGTYPVTFSVNADGRRWFLVPVRHTLSGSDPPRSGVAVGQCITLYSTHLAVDAATSAVEPYVYSIRELRCAGETTSTIGSWDRPLSTPIKGTAGVIDLDELQFEHEAAALQRMDEASSRVLQDHAQNPQKRRIGAKVCKVEGESTLVGFTEAVSPDMNRIQIRVVSVHTGSSKRYRNDAFREQILWDNPTNWSLCD